MLPDCPDSTSSPMIRNPHEHWVLSARLSGLTSHRNVRLSEAEWVDQRDEWAVMQSIIYTTVALTTRS